jgi:HlyD family secretion protein
LKRDQPDGSGTIECTQVQVAPQVGGRLLQLPPQEGDALTNGQLVAQIDASDYRLKRDEARAALALAQSQLDLLLAGSRTEDVQRGQAQVREARASAEAAAAEVKRIAQAFAQKSVTQKQMDDATAMAERTAAALTAAEQQLAKLVAGNRKEEIEVARSQVEVARSKLATSEKAIADCTVTAPMAGAVTTRSREVGEMVSPGAPLVTLSRLDEVWLSVYVPETQLGGVKLGQPARVKIDGEAKMFAGKVTFISPEAEFTPKNVQTPDERAKLVYRLKITLPNPDGVFKPGMPADGYLDAVK